MSKRIILAAIVLGLGFVGITLAQQEGEPSKQPASDKEKLRSEVVKLQVEVELLELEHEATRTLLLDLMVGMRKYEATSPKQKRRAAEMSMFFNSVEGEVGQDVNEAVKESTTRANDVIDRKRKEFAQQAEELAEKRLELSDVEERYNEAR